MTVEGWGLGVGGYGMVGGWLLVQPLEDVTNLLPISALMNLRDCCGSFLKTFVELSVRFHSVRDTWIYDRTQLPQGETAKAEGKIIMEQVLPRISPVQVFKNAQSCRGFQPHPSDSGFKSRLVRSSWFKQAYSLSLVKIVNKIILPSITIHPRFSMNNSLVKVFSSTPILCVWSGLVQSTFSTRINLVHIFNQIRSGPGFHLDQSDLGF